MQSVPLSFVWHVNTELRSRLTECLACLREKGVCYGTGLRTQTQGTGGFIQVIGLTRRMGNKITKRAPTEE